ncbi:hypothetical protein [Streptomyces sp. NPDC048002]|uniref:hypothetical protein n=1 Tax=Streptomyces sp. NPDC048002 TaxID=3154344 RepID=UPI0033E986F7
MVFEVWDGLPVLVGSRADRKAGWFGTRTKLFVHAAAVPSVDAELLARFTAHALAHAKSLRGGIPGARNVVTALPALISTDVHPSAVRFAARDAQMLDTSVVGRPVVVQVGPGVRRTTLYRGQVPWGGLFTRHVLRKADLYFP